MKYLLTAAAATVLLFGCDEPTTSPSDDVKTSGIDAHYTVSNFNGSYLVRAELSFGDDDPTYLSTHGGDELVATFNGITKTLTKSGYGHAAMFDIADGELTIDFNRTEFLSATGSDITLTRSSTFDSPAAGNTYTYSGPSDLAIRFDPGVYDSLEWTISCEEGDLSETRTGEVSNGINDGSYDISYSELFSSGPQLLDYPTNGCDVVFALNQKVTGSMSSEFKSGQFRADISSEVEITVIP